MTRFAAPAPLSPFGRLRAARRALLLSAAILASARPGAAAAQAIQATPQTVAGGVTYSRDTIASPGSETITISTNSAIIHWRPFNPPFPNPYPFLPAGNVVTFTNAGNPNFVVLNRVILLDVPILFAGTVRSRLSISAVDRPGGTVLFSNPSGIIVGPTGRFDVGNLVLTSLDVLEDSPGSFITPSGGFRFARVTGPPDSAVVLEAGSRIDAPSEGSYVALVAPRVVQGGTVRVNGSTGYIAGDSVEFSVNQGLFDIIVPVGTDNATPIVHTGSTGGPAASGAAGDNHRIYAVASGRNQAIRMLLQGSMGYDPAVAVGVENGVIVLSAGYNTPGGNIDPASVTGTPASIELGDGNFTTDVIGRATNTATATATTTDPLSFAGSVQLDAVGAISFVAGAGADIPVGEGLILRGASVDIDSATVGQTIDLSSVGATTIDNGSAGVSILVSAGGLADLGTVNAAEDLIVNAASIALDGGTAGDDINLNATAGDVIVLAAQAGDDFRATATGGFAGGNIVATGLGSDVEDVGTPEEGNNVLIAASGDVRLDNADVPDRIQLNSSTASVLSDGLLRAGTDIEITAAVDIDIADADAGGAMLLTAVDDIDAEDLTAVGSIVTDSGGDTIFANATSTGGSIDITADGVVNIPGTLRAQDNVTIDPISITVGDIFAGGDIHLDASTFISVGSADAGDDFTAAAGTTFAATTVIARGLRDSEPAGAALAGGNIAVDTGGDLTLHNGDARDDIRLLPKGGSIFSNTLLRAGSDILADAPLGGITVNGAIAGNDATFNARLNIAVTSAEAGDDFVANAGGTFTGGNVTVTGLGPDSEAGAGALGGRNILVDSIGNLRLDTGTVTGGVIDLASANASVLSGGTLTADSLLATAAIDLLLNDVFVVTSLNLATTNGDIGGNRFESDGAITLNASDAVTLAFADSVGSTAVTAGGLADLGTFTSGVDIAVNAGAIDFDSANAARDVTLDAAANIAVANAQAGDDFIADAGGTFTGGTVTITGAGADSEAGAGALGGRNILVDSVGNLRLATGTTPGTIDLGSSGGSIFSTGTLSANRLLAAAAFDLALNNVGVVAPLVLNAPGGSITGNLFTSNGDVLLTASGNVVLADGRSGGLLSVDAGGAANLGNAQAATDVDVDAATIVLAAANAGRDILLDATGNIDVGNAVAARNFTATGGANGEFSNVGAASIAIVLAGGARFDGNLAAPVISVASSDIDIPSGSFGNAATQSVTLTARATGRQTLLGGTAQGAGYTLTDAEADRISAATLVIQASPNGTAANRAPDVLVRDLSLSGQRIGTLQLTTAGILQVEGGLLLAGVRPGGAINLTATERLQIANPTGSIRVRDAGGLTDGNILLVSNNIWSATPALLDQLRADSNFAGRDAALLVNNGPIEPRGYIEAGDVVLSARDSLFVQNSGTLLSFAGITVRETTLRIVPSGTQPLRVFAFGNRINPDGSFVTNNAFFNEVQYQGRGGPVGYTDDAQFNLCFINTGICRLPAPDNRLPGGPEIIEEPIGDSFMIALPGSADDLVDSSFADEPLIEEPVTSGGDSILWDCDNDDDGDCDEDDYDG